MYKVLQVFEFENRCCISVEGNIKLLKNGIRLKDENGNLFIIESVAMVNYKNIEDYKRYADLFLKGNVANIGKQLYIVK